LEEPADILDESDSDESADESMDNGARAASSGKAEPGGTKGGSGGVKPRVQWLLPRPDRGWRREENEQEKESKLMQPLASKGSRGSGADGKAEKTGALLNESDVTLSAIDDANTPLTCTTASGRTVRTAAKYQTPLQVALALSAKEASEPADKKRKRDADDKADAQ